MKNWFFFTQIRFIQSFFWHGKKKEDSFLCFRLILLFAFVFSSRFWISSAYVTSMPTRGNTMFWKVNSRFGFICLIPGMLYARRMGYAYHGLLRAETIIDSYKAKLDWFLKEFFDWSPNWCNRIKDPINCNWALFCYFIQQLKTISHWSI